MPVSNYPNGFPQGVNIRGVPLTITNPGKVFWLSNATTLQPGDRGGSDSNKGTHNSPFATLAGAIAACVAGRGDIIIVEPGHAETISTATALAIATSGVAVIGLGVGSARPKWTISTANTATIAVSADNVSFTNCQFVGNFLSIAACFTLSTAKNFTLQSCSFADAGATTNFLNIVKSTGAANTIDGITLMDNTWNGLGTTSVNSFLLTANDIDGAMIMRNRVNLARTADAPIYVAVTAGVLTNFAAGENVGISKQTATTGGSFTNVAGTTSTGVLYRNFMQTLCTTDVLYTTTVGLAAFENYVSGVIGASGYIIPARDS
jgi:hypothetical protein